jgi:ATP-dependent DNA ligase
MASTTTTTRARRTEQGSPPTWVKPELAALVKAAPDGPGWLHEIKFDGYRMHARLHRSATQSGALNDGRVNILTRRGNN